MASQPGMTVLARRPRRRGWRALWCLLIAPPLLVACAGVAPSGESLARLPPFEHGGAWIEPGEVARLAPTPDLLAVDAEMKAFVERYTGGLGSRRQRLMSLHEAISGSAALGMEYDPLAEGTASEAFHRQSANCLSYANLFVALAREAGLDARYQWVDVRPQWTRMGERIAVRLHVNAVIHLNARDRYMVDLDPLPARDITGSNEIGDRDAQALYHANTAMDALADDRLQQAWLHAVRALQISPAMSHLWVNLGVVYRRAGQLQAAEMAYLQALEIDPLERSAMNNLMVLYELQGRDRDYAYWRQRVDNYRHRNPYYHAWLGDQAAEEGDWQGARRHYQEALALQPQDGKLLFALGVIHRELQQPRAALRYIERALDSALLAGEREAYRVEYEKINRRLLAAQ